MHCLHAARAVKSSAPLGQSLDFSYIIPRVQIHLVYIAEFDTSDCSSQGCVFSVLGICESCACCLSGS